MNLNELFSLEGKTAIITGASRGLGFAIARGYAMAGASVLITSRHSDEAEAAAVEIQREFGHPALGIAADVSKPVDVDRMVEQALKAWGHIDLLMTNAGIINRPRANAWEIDEATWDSVIDINLKGTFLCCRRVLMEMIPRRSGKILCMASIQSVIAQPGHSPYIASKGGINQMVKALALECAPYGINVNAIGPTYVRSDLVDVTLQDPEKAREVLAKLPLGRIGEPEDLIGACIFLSSKAADYITGHLLMIDGGHTIH
ncbi:MAG: glucose 1-dehydrogenase [Anaerolineales bacterium]|nr:glucose 1-dehydrogenase [Anaerolineales bacterium]